MSSLYTPGSGGPSGSILEPMSAPGEQQESHSVEGTGGPSMQGPVRDSSALLPVASPQWITPTFRYAPGLSAATVPGARAAHSANLVGNVMLVFGGWTGKSVAQDLVALDVDTMTWFVPETKGTSASARNNHASFVAGTKLYIHGGHDGRTWLSDLFCLDTSTWTWSQPEVSGSVPSPRACHSLTYISSQQKAFCFGGYSGSKCFDQLDVLDLPSNVWLSPRVSGAVPQARNAQTVTEVRGQLFLFGGHSGNKHLKDLHVFDTLSMSWSQPDVRGSLPPGLRGHTASLVGNHIFLFGGYDGRARSQSLYLLDTETLTWSHPAENDSTPAGRQRHSAVLIRNKELLVFGGFDGTSWLNGASILDVGKMQELSVTNASVASLLGDLRSLINNPSSFPDVTFIVGASAPQNNFSSFQQPAQGSASPSASASASMLVFGGGSGGGGSGSADFSGSSGHSPLHELGSSGGGVLGMGMSMGIGGGGSSGGTSTSTAAMAAPAGFSFGGAGAGGHIASSSSASSTSSSTGGGGAGGQAIVAHKAILAARCSHFRAMFSSGMKESAKGCTVEYPDWSPQAFLAMLQFIYCGSITGLSTPVALELLSLSDHIALDGLRVLAETALTNSVDASNVCTFISCAHKYGASQLKGFCLEYILKHADAVSLDALDALADTPTLLIEITKLVLSRKKGT